MLNLKVGMPEASARTKERYSIYLNMGFRPIVERSEVDRKVAIDLAKHLRESHGLSNITGPVARRWLTHVDAWQEPRVTVGMWILDWWKNNKDRY